MATRFEYRNIRQHGSAKLSGRIYTVRCCQCGATATHEVDRATPDTDLKKEFGRRGWIIAKDQSHDLCPVHAGTRPITPENRLAAVFKVSKDGDRVPGADEIVAQEHQERKRRALETDSLLSKHLAPSTPETRSEEPGMVQLQPLRIETGLSLEQTLQLATALTGIHQALSQVSQQMGEVSAAMQLLAEESSQTRAAIAQIVPTLIRTNEGLTHRLDHGFTRLHEGLEALRPADQDELRQEISRVAETVMQRPDAPVAQATERAAVAAEVRAAAEAIIGQPVPTLDVTDPVIEEIPNAAAIHDAEDMPHRVDYEVVPDAPDVPAAPVARLSDDDRRVYARSWPDKAKAGKFRTQVYIGRALFDLLKFTRETKFRITREGDTLTITPDPKGGAVKILNAKSAVLQSTMVGNAGGELGEDLVVVMQDQTLKVSPRTGHRPGPSQALNDLMAKKQANGSAGHAAH